MEYLHEYIPEDSALNRPALESTDARRVGQYVEFFEEYFDLDGNPKTLEGQKLYDKHLMGTWWTREQRWDNNDEENRSIDFLFNKIARELTEVTNAVDQLHYIIEKIRKRSNTK